MKYKFELGDVRAVITVINVMLIMRYGLSVAWFGLAVASIGVVADIYCYGTSRFRINSLVMHLANAVLNIHFLCIM